MASANQDLLDKLLSLAVDNAPSANIGVKSTTIPGYPLFSGWGFLTAIEVDQSKGTRKALMLCPFVSVPAVSLQVQAACQPVGLIETEMTYPQNLKLKIPNHLNASQLCEGSPYLFMAALKPGAVGGNRGSNAIAYWDGYLMAASQSTEIINPFFKEFKSSLNYVSNTSQPVYDQYNTSSQYSTSEDE
ncbi:MAG: hypothetical protein WAN66_14155 [Limnoraphis robusta]|uniref:Uncharacterized protein n=1 Tax=Limnoraphis robusta CS-951 TaxID=1637645 RepID=A0A0F5YIR6_9CYAN|nr:hypothetical protein [Limnoraphis robusta]KKD38786.1 hypothetical protein WN50_07000 [Limnoraphis robusta CS-951]